MSSLKNILVTGGLGYIGSHTVIELAQAGFEPIILDNFSNASPVILQGIERILKRKVKIFNIDCTNEISLKDLFRTYEIDGVIHFASLKNVNESTSEPLKYYKNNLDSLMTLMQVMAEFKISNLVFSSSCAVYGDAVQLPVMESSPILLPKSPYGNTKKVCEEIIHDHFKSNVNFKGIILRFFNPIGAHPSAEIGEYHSTTPSNLLPIMMEYIVGKNKTFVIHGNTHDTPDGTCIRDFIHICDLAKSHVKAFQHLEKSHLPRNYLDIFNIGTGKGCSILEFIKKFERVTNLLLPYQIGKSRSGDISCMYANSDKAENILGWKAEKSVEDAISDAWRWHCKSSLADIPKIVSGN